MSDSYSSISTSNIIESDFFTDNDLITEYEELPSQSNLNQLYRIKRYGHWFVLKCLKPEYANQCMYVTLLQKEFDLAVSLDHPYIVKTIAKENNDKLGPSIIMEYVDGMTLKSFLKTHPSNATKKRIVFQLLEVLRYIHSKQVIHRDLKPANIMITHNGNNVKLIDFGLADADSFSIFKQPAGTKRYAAPEQLTSGMTIDNRTDIYAFGKILHELFPHKYASIVKKCTKEDSALRYSDVESVQKAFVRQRTLWKALLAVLVVGLLTFLSVFAGKYYIQVQQQEQKVVMEEQIISDSYAFIDSIYAPLQERIENGYYTYSEFAYYDIQSTYPLITNEYATFAPLYGDTTTFYSQLSSSYHLKWGRTLQHLDKLLEKVPSFYLERQMRHISEEEYEKISKEYKALPSLLK